jgi:hypothetical protein
MPKSNERRIRLANFIMIHGTEMPPCDRCMLKDLKCIKHATSHYCSECKRSNHRCSSIAPSVQDWDNLDKEQKRIQSDRAKALADAQEALARVARLDKQQELLKTRGGEMLSRGLRSLDELEALDACAGEKDTTPAPLSHVQPPQAALDWLDENPLSPSLLDLD